jgi:D-alanine-D-alanine ligase
MRAKPKEPPGVVVLYNESQTLVKGEAHDMIAENSVITCASAIAEALEGDVKVAKVPIFTDVEKALLPYPPTEWVVFNLGEGVEGRLFECARIGWALEAMGYCFTGAGGYSLALTSHKEQTKQRLRQASIPTPPGWLFRHGSEVPDGLPFPLIVKPLVEDGSLGIEDDAIVHNLDDLKARVDYIYRVYRQVALAEKFIPGREFNLSVWNEPPEVLPICEIDFSDYDDPSNQIVSFAAKWEEGTYDYHHTPGICPAVVDAQLSGRLTQIALDSWYALACKDYARVDMRVDLDGNPFVIEVNCNPDLSPDAGFYRSAGAAGYTYKQMVANILNTALKSFKSCSYFEFRQQFELPEPR